MKEKLAIVLQRRSFFRTRPMQNLTAIEFDRQRCQHFLNVVWAPGDMTLGYKIPSGFPRALDALSDTYNMYVAGPLLLVNWQRRDRKRRLFHFSLVSRFDKTR